MPAKRRHDRSKRRRVGGVRGIDPLAIRNFVILLGIQRGNPRLEGRVKALMAGLRAAGAAPKSPALPGHGC